jgi:hypothetical protein
VEDAVEQKYFRWTVGTLNTFVIAAMIGLPYWFGFTPWFSWLNAPFFSWKGMALAGFGFLWSLETSLRVEFKHWKQLQSANAEKSQPTNEG